MAETIPANDALPPDCPTTVSILLSSVERGNLSDSEYYYQVARRITEKLRRELWALWGDERANGIPRFRQYTIDWEEVKIIDGKVIAPVKWALPGWIGRQLIAERADD